KIFISAVEHDLTDNIIHLVLARIEGAPEGTKGISLFIVPKFLVVIHHAGGVGVDAHLVLDGATGDSVAGARRAVLADKEFRNDEE
ncbi:hypothetical protein AB9E13_34370, partial [Rhizobium leguminosarum]